MLHWAAENLDLVLWSAWRRRLRHDKSGRTGLSDTSSVRFRARQAIAYSCWRRAARSSLCCIILLLTNTCLESLPRLACRAHFSSVTTEWIVPTLPARNCPTAANCARTATLRCSSPWRRPPAISASQHQHLIGRPHQNKQSRASVNRANSGSFSLFRTLRCSVHSRQFVRLLRHYFGTSRLDPRRQHHYRRTSRPRSRSRWDTCV